MAFPFRPITYRKTPHRSAQRGFSGGTGGFHHLSFDILQRRAGRWLLLAFRGFCG